MFLLGIGLWLLRQYLMPSVKVNLPPSGAAPWQRVRIDSRDDRNCMSSDSTQALPTLGGSTLSSGDVVPTTSDFLPTVGKDIPLAGTSRPPPANSHG